MRHFWVVTDERGIVIAAHIASGDMNDDMDRWLGRMDALPNRTANKIVAERVTVGELLSRDVVILV